MATSFSHFISLEFDIHSDDYQIFLSKVKGIQNLLGDVSGIGKAVKQESLHITLAVLHVAEEELPGLIEKIRKVWEEYMDNLGNPSKILVSFKGISFKDQGSIWTKMELGKEVIMVLRQMIEAVIGEFLTDLRFECHMTLFRSSEMSEELKQAIEGSASKINLGSATIKKISLRPRKVGKIEEPVLILTFGDEETAE